jgi:SAM-dependent methyltransferase
MQVGLKAWHSVCNVCKYENGDFQVAINDVSKIINEDDREVALKDLRQSNFAVIAKFLTAQFPNGGKLLDVGCAHGWFLEETRAHFAVLGIEPDAAVFARARAKSLPVREGFFPDVLEESERFDVIVFNDVIEHIPDIESALRECNKRLLPNGYLLLNLPNSRGFFYQLSKLFTRLGSSGPFERMWQKELPSPHVHYFGRLNLSRLVSNFNMVETANFSLPSLRAEGLMERLRFTGGSSKFNLYIQWVLLMGAMPFLNMLPSDIIVCAFQKRS